MTAEAQVHIRNLSVIETINPTAPCNGSYPCWLTKKFSSGSVIVADPRVNTDVAEATQYYLKIQAFRDTATLNTFKIKNQFILSDGSPRNVGITAFYFNNGDLQFGREMHCNEQGEHRACYVSNYGPQPYPPGTLDNNATYPNLGQSLTELEAVASGAGTAHPFATVAMESLPPAPAPKMVVVREADGVTSDLNPPKFCAADYSGNIAPTNSDVDTGLDLETGDTVVFSATGALWAGYCFNGRNSPDGMAWTVQGQPDYPLDTAHEDALIGRVGQPGGPTGAYFEIGSQFTYQHSGKPGRLFLRTNDNKPGNGSGAFFVSVLVKRQQVRFYVYDGQGNLSKTAALDREGPKLVPQMCMACHGGEYSTQTHEATGTSFLPFDVFSFLYSDKPGLRLDDQQESFRRLNLLVKNTNPNSENPNQPIHRLIDDLYNNQLTVPNTHAVTAKTPAAWAGHDVLYQSFYARYCRTCHAASSTQDFYSNFELFRVGAGGDVCGGIMPHAQAPYTALVGTKLDFVEQQDLTALTFHCLVSSVPPRIVLPPGR
jgi:cytochrome c5